MRNHTKLIIKYPDMPFNIVKERRRKYKRDETKQDVSVLVEKMGDSIWNRGVKKLSKNDIFSSQGSFCLQSKHNPRELSVCLLIPNVICLSYWNSLMDSVVSMIIAMTRCMLLLSHPLKTVIFLSEARYNKKWLSLRIKDKSGINQNFNEWILGSFLAQWSKSNENATWSS